MDAYLDGPSLAALSLKRLQAREWTLALAESVTGGLVGHWLTEQPGCSLTLRGVVVPYAYRSKTELLAVPADVLEREGAVSYAVAREEALAARRLFGADVGVAVTGIAGPTGGTPGKPVGLTIIALSGPFGNIVGEHRLSGERSEIKRAAARLALARLAAAVGE